MVDVGAVVARVADVGTGDVMQLMLMLVQLLLLER